MRSRRKKRFIAGLGVAACIGSLLCIALCLNFLSGLQLRSSDFLFQADALYQGTEPVKEVVVIGIDDKSLEELGQLSLWPRSNHAQLIDVLAQAEARVVAFDILFAEPTPDDEQLANSMNNAGNVLLPVVYPFTEYAYSGASNLLGSGEFIRPLSLLEESAIALGHANVFPDDDGVVRRLPLVIESGGESEPALALATVSKYLRRPQVLETPIENNSLSFVGRTIPLDSSNSMLINYVAGSAAMDTPTSYQIVSYVDAMRGEIDDSVFRDKIVLVGATAIGIGDIFWTPTGSMMNGVEVHANTIQTILSANFLKPAHNGITIAIVFALALLCGLAVLRLKIKWAVLSAGCACIVYLLIAFTCFDNGVMLNMVYPPMAIAGSFMGVSVYNFASERSEKNRITQTFGRYISTPVAENILTAMENDELRLGGEQTEVTVAFADIRGFTSMSENIQPAELVRVLNIYLSIVIDSILKYDGMVNKFGGDSVMAVWNAPTKCEEHALMATKAAIDAQHAIQALQQEDISLPKVDFGIGINTGHAIAGNLGSENRSEYSVIGDSVNIASRLTSAAEGGKVWIGANTYEIVKNHVQVKALEPITVKGKRELVHAYEVIDIYQKTSGYVESM